MALVIPDSIPSKASKGEKMLFRLLRDELPDDFFVYYEPITSGFYPDFIILSPSFGLLILEVKGWSVKQIHKADSFFFDIEQDGQLEHCQSPMRQAKGYLDTLLSKLKGYSILCQDDGDYQGKLVCPVGVGAVMTNITEAQARENHIYALLEKPQVCYKDELMTWQEIGERALIKRLEAMFTVRFKFADLEDDQINTIRGVIHPEAQVRQEPAKPSSVPEGKLVKPDAIILKTLDYRQEQLARSLNSGHRLFSGVAGSGKTLILLSRAKILAGGWTDTKVLILCYNMALASYWRSLIKEDYNLLYHRRIEVMHFHAWAKSVLGGLPNLNYFKGDDIYDYEMGTRLLNALQKIPSDDRWDAILIDEGHTFHPKWFECCTAALKDPEDGDLVIVSDRSQSIYRRPKFTWKSVGVKAQGRMRKLTQNYRNTEEILQLAWAMIRDLSSAEDDELEDETFPVVEPLAAVRHGKIPQLYIKQNRMDEINGVIDTIKKLVNEGYKPHEIAVIYRYNGKNERQSFEYLIETLDHIGVGVFWVNDNKHDYKSNYCSSHPGVRVVTCKSALGLEFKAVIIPWVQQFGVGEKAEARRELYVAMTRAQDVLYLFGSGYFDFLRELKMCDRLVVA